MNPFPPALESYADVHLATVWEVLQNRARQQPFNLYAALIFLAAVTHTFLSHRFIHWAHLLERRHLAKLKKAPLVEGTQTLVPELGHTSMPARALHFLGEVEVIFGIWVLPLAALMAWKLGSQTTLDYLSHRVSYDEAWFVVVIMVISSTKPIVGLAQSCLRFFAKMGGRGPGAWWLAILTLGPVLGSLITEPAAMTISALLLGQQFYALKPGRYFAYATLGLLFVNVSVGGVLTQFAAPPVLMVAAAWGWTTWFMLRHFGWVALLGIVLANLSYYAVFRRNFTGLASTVQAGSLAEPASAKVQRIPPWITFAHLAFMAWTVLNAHHPVLLIGGFLFFIAFFEVTADYQSDLQLRSPILVGFFLAGLVIHGGLQQWWIQPVLSRLNPVPLMFGAVGLTAFNDNAAVTYLSTLVPNLTDAMKHAVVAGAVAGGGLTVIANAPNPAGQSMLNRFFPEGIAPLGLLLGSLPATAILILCFLFL